MVHDRPAPNFAIVSCSQNGNYPIISHSCATITMNSLRNAQYLHCLFLIACCMQQPFQEGENMNWGSHLITLTVTLSSLHCTQLHRVSIFPGLNQIPSNCHVPSKTIQFQCRILLPSAALIWDLPTGDSLEFGVLRKVGDICNSSDNIYSATLTGKTEEDEHTDRFLFTSTLLVLQPVNQSTLTCKGGTVAEPVEQNTTITLSGEWSLAMSPRAAIL